MGQLEEVLDVAGEVFVVGAVDLGGNAEFGVAGAGDLDGAIDALFRGDAAEEGEVLGASVGSGRSRSAGMPWWTVPAQPRCGTGLRWLSEIETIGTRGNLE